MLGRVSGSSRLVVGGKYIQVYEEMQPPYFCEFQSIKGIRKIWWLPAG